MYSSKVAKRYAQGLLEFSSENNSVQEIFGEMKAVAKVLGESKELTSFFATPLIDEKKKAKIADEIFSGFSQTSKNFIKLVIKQNRESELKNIATEYINKVEDINGVQRVTLTSATTLSPEMVNKILKSAEIVDTSKNFELETQIKPEILGGYILRIGDQQIDASVKSKLNQIKKEFQLN